MVVLLKNALIVSTLPLHYRNVHFYYTGGVAVGILASLLILIYIFSRFVPKRNLFGLGVLLGGYSFAGFFLHLIYSQGIAFVQENLFFVSCYVLISGMVSFAVLYRMGPAHERTMTLLKWFLQLLGLALIFVSMQYLPFGLLLVGSLVVWNNVPSWLSSFVSTA